MCKFLISIEILCVIVVWYIFGCIKIMMDVSKNYVSRKTGRTKIVVKNLEIYTLECQINKGRGGRVLIIVRAGNFPDILKGGGGVLINGNR